MNLNETMLTFAPLVQLLHGSGILERLLLFYFDRTIHLQIEFCVLNRLRARPNISHG